VRFLGHLPPGDAVRKELDAADLFVLPSRTEGLPRALIEAMARALPCIGSSVGGIPELLSPSERFPPDDVDALAGKILEILGDRNRCSRLSHENLQKAGDHHLDALRPRRQAFYRAVREATAEWQRRNQQRRRALTPRSAETLG
jgi:glycosyltransferase involved in cell wall biosynthesis